MWEIIAVIVVVVLIFLYFQGGKTEGIDNKCCPGLCGSKIISLNGVNPWILSGHY